MYRSIECLGILMFVYTHLQPYNKLCHLLSFICSRCTVHTLCSVSYFCWSHWPADPACLLCPLQLQSDKEQRKLKQREAYLSLYFTWDVCIFFGVSKSNSRFKLAVFHCIVRAYCFPLAAVRHFLLWCCIWLLSWLLSKRTPAACNTVRPCSAW